MPGYVVGPTLAPGERPWEPAVEVDPKVNDGHEHRWECVLTQPRRLARFCEAVRCEVCHVPRCGDTYDLDPCMEPLHHLSCHRYLSGWREHLGGSAWSCACT